jgi:hypothetical protein
MSGFLIPRAVVVVVVEVEVVAVMALVGLAESVASTVGGSIEYKWRGGS